MKTLTLSEINSTSLSLITGLMITVSLFLSVPFISGLMNEDEQEPVLVFNSINLYKKIITPVKNQKKKPKPKVKKPKKKIVKKIPKKIKKEIKKVVKKKKILDNKFATKKQKIEKVVEKIQPEELPVAEPIYRVSEKPHFLLQANLEYPSDMKVMGKMAVVLLDVLIDRFGKVRKVTVFKSAGKSFDDAAIKAVMASAFTPGNIAGKPCAVILRLPMRFNLR